MLLWYHGGRLLCILFTVRDSQDRSNAHAFTWRNVDARIRRCFDMERWNIYAFLRRWNHLIHRWGNVVVILIDLQSILARLWQRRDNGHDRRPVMVAGSWRWRLRLLRHRVPSLRRTQVSEWNLFGFKRERGPNGRRFHLASGRCGMVFSVAFRDRPYPGRFGMR